MAKDNRRFVRNSIIIAIIGLIVFIVALLIVGQFLISPKESREYIKEQLQDIEEKIPLNESEIIVVKTISAQGVTGYEVNKGASVEASLAKPLTIFDAYGNPLPLQEIQIGDIVEIGYSEGKDKIITIKECLEVEAYKKITGVVIDKENKQIDIGGIRYPYKEQLMVIDSKHTLITTDDITPFDIVSIYLYKDVVWSIKQEEAFATLTIADIPSLNGKLEIDYSRVIPCDEIKEPIKIIPGEHQIVVKIQGYQSLVYALKLKGGEQHILSLKEMKRAYTKLYPRINAPNYEIHINNKTYHKGDDIQLPQDDYIVSVTAEGYESWKGTLHLNKEIQSLNISLIHTKLEEEQEQGIDENESIEESEDIEESNNHKDRTVNLSTDPSGAKVYIEGAYKGTTPYTITLPYGSYNILFEKQGYEVYATQILIDESNDQSNFLYALTETE